MYVSQLAKALRRILYIFFWMRRELIKEILSIRISNETIFAESNWIASDRYYSSGFMGIFNRASGKAHAHRDCSFVWNVGARIGVNNFFIAVPILSPCSSSFPSRPNFLQFFRCLSIYMRQQNRRCLRRLLRSSSSL